MTTTISVGEAAARLGLTRQRVAKLAKQRRIVGARLIGRIWFLPEELHILPGKPGRGPAKPKP